MNRLEVRSRAILIILMISGTVSAQIPRSLSYQGVLTDSTGMPKPDGAYSFMFRLYADSGGGAPLWTEIKTLPLTHGLFNTSLGDQNPIALPFDRPYWLGIVVGAAPELQPRIRLNSVGYSIRSSVADSVGDAAIGATKIAAHQLVKSLNGIQDTVILRATGGATVTSHGDTITINAGSGSGNSGIQGLQSPKGTISIAAPNGPTTSIDVKDQGIGTAQLADSAVSPIKLNTEGALSDYVLKAYWDSNDRAIKAAWQKDGFVLPYVGSGMDGFALLVMKNTGGGRGGYFENDSSGTNPALEGNHLGKGPGLTGRSQKDAGVAGYGRDGVRGTGTDGAGVGGYGGTGVYGSGRGRNNAVGVLAWAEGDASTSVLGEGTNYGVWGAGGNIGVYAHNTGGTSAGRDVYLATRSLAADMYGDVYVHGNVTKSGGAFRIDHPLDPANKYLYHSFVESPDMKNIYDGMVSLDATGTATVTLPPWFEALNKDFRYQLTAIGSPGPNLYVAQKIAGNTFVIAGGTAGMEVSWQVTGTRQDAWADAHRIPVEEAKPKDEKGYYEHPELFGQPEGKSLVHAVHPENQPMAAQQDGRREELRASSEGNANSQR